MIWRKETFKIFFYKPGQICNILAGGKQSPGASGGLGATSVPDKRASTRHYAAPQQAAAPGRGWRGCGAKASLNQGVVELGLFMALKYTLSSFY